MVAMKKSDLMLRFKRSLQPQQDIESDSELIQTLKTSLNDEQMALKQIDERKNEKKLELLNATRDTVDQLVNLNNSYDDEENSFRYIYQQKYTKSKGFVQLFETDKHMYVLSQNNQKLSNNLLNPFYAEVSLTRYKLDAYMKPTLVAE